jgi:hypothetical protein
MRAVFGCPSRSDGDARSRNGVAFSIASVIVRNGKIAEMDFLADPERLSRLDLTILDGSD